MSSRLNIPTRDNYVLIEVLPIVHQQHLWSYSTHTFCVKYCIMLLPFLSEVLMSETVNNILSFVSCLKKCSNIDNLFYVHLIVTNDVNIHQIPLTMKNSSVHIATHSFSSETCIFSAISDPFQLSLPPSFTDQPHQRVFSFCIFRTLTNCQSKATCILDDLGDTPNILDFYFFLAYLWLVCLDILSFAPIQNRGVAGWKYCKHHSNLIESHQKIPGNR